MNDIANVARQQQQQTKSMDAKVQQEAQVQKAQEQDLVKVAQENSTKVNSKEQVEDLVKQLNDALAPMRTNLSFGVDTDDIFYVSVNEIETNRMIRRFPAEQAMDFLPKMQEVSGLLFDTKG